MTEIEVYLSDGYPQATAGTREAIQRQQVYLSDGYPQATAPPVASIAQGECT